MVYIRRSFGCYGEVVKVIADRFMDFLFSLSSECPLKAEKLQASEVTLGIRESCGHCNLDIKQTFRLSEEARDITKEPQLVRSPSIYFKTLWIFVDPVIFQHSGYQFQMATRWLLLIFTVVTAAAAGSKGVLAVPEGGGGEGGHGDDYRSFGQRENALDGDHHDQNGDLLGGDHLGVPEEGVVYDALEDIYTSSPEYEDAVSDHEPPSVAGYRGNAPGYSSSPVGYDSSQDDDYRSPEEVPDYRSSPVGYEDSGDDYSNQADTYSSPESYSAQGYGYDAPAVKYESPELPQCPTKTLYTTRYQYKLQKLPVLHTVYSEKYVPTTVYEPVYETVYHTQVKTQLVPEYVTTTAYSKVVTYIPDYQTKYQTVYKTQYLDKTEYVDHYVTETSYHTVYDTKVQYQTVYETEYVPRYVTQTKVQYQTLYKTQFVPKYLEATQTVLTYKTVCPVKGHHFGYKM
ncbi:uncharacterized protein LOC135207755 [Macrobrachium nipponense]|uniref:uncharacterized protein LOC135207755 n=1 Tax=Macrobrachium nipponense TaxID=159736 RepID=UPI0030C81813